jgi:hypothetical protein
MGKEQCETCRFYFSKLILNADGKWHPSSREKGQTPAEFESDGDETAGECRRYPPAAKDQFPDVYLDQWCGEYQPRTPLRVVE